MPSLLVAETTVGDKIGAIMMRSCDVCGNQFEPGRSTQRFCSGDCRGKSKTVRVMPNPCPQCGATITTEQMKQTYCSIKCWMDFNQSIPEEVKKARRLEVRRAWNAANKEKQRQYYMKDSAKEKRRAWVEAHPENLARYQEKSRRLNKERIADSAMRYMLSERGQRARQKHRLKCWSDPKLRMKRIVEAAFVRAIRMNLEFDQCIREILMDNPPMECVCCGETFNYNEAPSKTRRRNSPSIDRVDNNKGYVVGNVQIICWGCNEDKSHLTLEKLERFIRYIQAYSGKVPAGQGVA